MKSMTQAAAIENKMADMFNDPIQDRPDPSAMVTLVELEKSPVGSLSDLRVSVFDGAKSALICTFSITRDSDGYWE